VLLVHPLVAFEQDASGLVLEDSVTLLDPDLAGALGLPALIETAPDGAPWRVWRSVARNGHFELERLDVENPGPPEVVGFTQAELIPTLMAGNQMAHILVERDGLGDITAVSTALTAVPDGSHTGEITVHAVTGTTGAQPLAYVPATNRLLIRSDNDGDDDLRVVELADPNAPTLREDVLLYSGSSLLTLRDGSVLGYFFNEEPEVLRVELGVISPDLVYRSLAAAPASPTAVALSPDGERFYVAEPDAILELELVRDAAQQRSGVLVRSRIGVEGTPTLLSLDASGEHVLYVDQAQGLVGLLE